MSDLQLHNTLTGRKETFKPLTPGHAGLYVCGITPYDETHVGHARCYVVFDVLKRTLKNHGYQVKHIQNFTDVDDKIIKRANETNRPPMEFPKPFIESFKRYMEQLNVLPADEYPLVTTHMADIVRLIERLIARGFAYELEGSVYYSVRKFGAPYVRLSKRNLDELESGARVQVDERKKDPLDFALWKKAKEGEPSWDSPWSQGRPGWHIECSAMSMKYLGETFDLHGGGLDLVFPHHTNEIAQSEGATGKTFANMWVHNGFVTVDDEKMSKSLGNFFTIKDIFAKFDPMVVRYFLLSQHYRSPLNFSDQALDVAKKTWVDRICGAYAVAQAAEANSKGKAILGADSEFSGFISQLEAGLSQDLNTPVALAALNEYCGAIFKQPEAERSEWTKIREGMDKMLDLLGLKIPSGVPIDADAQSLLQQRDEARAKKDWKRSDQIRDALKAKGFTVEDTPSGPRLKRI